MATKKAAIKRSAAAKGRIVSKGPVGPARIIISVVDHCWLQYTLEGNFWHKNGCKPGESTTLHAARGENVQFECEYPFSICFSPLSPFDRTVSHPVEDPKTGVHVIKTRVDDHATVGYYKYTVAVYDGTRVLIDDPGVGVAGVSPCVDGTGGRTDHVQG